MKKINVLKLTIIILLLSSILFNIGCKTPTNEPPTYNVEYINSKLDATGFKSYYYQETIFSGNLKLLEENTNVTLQGEKYLITTEISRLSVIEGQNKYEIEETTEEVEIQANPVALTISENDFETVKVTENSLIGTIKDTSNVLGYSTHNLNLKISLQNSKLSSIELSYTDVKTGLLVNVIVKYNY